MHIPQHLGLLKNSEVQFQDALTLVAARHERDFEVREGCKQLATWSRERIATLESMIKRFGEVKNEDPEKLRSAILQGTRIGGYGVLRDIQDLKLLAGSVRTYWTALHQAMGDLHETEWEEFTDRGMKEVDRQIAWLDTQIKVVAPQALIGTAEKKSEIEASLPKHPSSAAVPDPIWAPLVGGGVLLVAGAISLLAGKPFLLPSLGPTAYLVAEMPAHPSSRWYNIVVGHLVGIVVGFACVGILNAWNDPILLQTGLLSGARMWAAVIALFLTIFIAYLLRATHPPAGATTLLVALGSIHTTEQVVYLMIGAVILALVGEPIRRIRLGQWLSRAGKEPRTPMDAGRSLTGSKQESLRA